MGNSVWRGFFFFYCNTEVGTVFQPCKGACLGATLEGDRSWRFHSALWLLFSSFTGISLWDIKHKKNYNRSDPVTHTVVSRHTAGWKMQIRSSAELGKSFSSVGRFIGYTEQCVIPLKCFLYILAGSTDKQKKKKLKLSSRPSLDALVGLQPWRTPKGRGS